MKVQDLKTGKVMEVNEGYGARLIEQGTAVLPKKGDFHAKARIPSAPAADETPALEKGKPKKASKE